MKPPEMEPNDCRAVLASLGVTRTGLARLLGVDAQTLARAERGDGRFARVYRLLLAALDVAYSPDAQAARHVALCRAALGACDECVHTKVWLPDSAYAPAVRELAEFLAGAADGRSRPRGGR